MTTEQNNLLGRFLGVVREPQPWLMTPSERIAILGLLALLKPARALELGHRFGGCAEWLSQYCGEVVSVDMDPHILESAKRFPNVTPMHMKTTEALPLLREQNQKFDLCIVDADHTTPGARFDLEQSLEIAEVLVLHDASNPVCREGYVQALEDKDVYYNMDWIDGRLIPGEGLWGGLGVVATRFLASTPFLLPLMESNYPLMAKEYQRQQSLPVRALRKVRRLVGI